MATNKQELSVEELEFILSAPWSEVIAKYGEEAIAAYLNE